MTENLRTIIENIDISDRKQRYLQQEKEISTIGLNDNHDRKYRYLQQEIVITMIGNGGIYAKKW